MINKIQKGTFAMLLMLGLLFVATAPNAEAQSRGRRRSNYQSTYYQDRSIDDRYYDRNYYDDRYDREDTKTKAIKRTAIGAGIGALGGALLGGKKGALIGAGVGAGGGYIYHRHKVNRDRDRYYRY